MQRLGFCKVAVRLSPEVTTSTELAQMMRQRLEDNRITVEPSPELTEWLSRKGRHELEQYTDTKTVAIQDYYVINHPSKTGWLSRDGFNEYAEYLPRRLLLLDDMLRRTEMGDLLADHLLRDAEQRSEPDGENGNILLLDSRQQILFLHQLLLADGDFLLPFIRALAEAFGEQPFNYLQAGNLLPQVCRQVAKVFLEHAYSLEDRDTLRKLESTGKKIEQQIAESIESKGSGSRREQTSIPRLEWLVDLGFVARQTLDGSSRVFNITERGTAFASAAYATYTEQLKTRYADKAITALLDEQFYGIVNDVYFKGTAEKSTDEDILDFVAPAYRRLTTLGGYYLFRPLLLLANVEALESHGSSRFCEYARALELLETAYRESPDRVSYSIDRFSTDYQLRIA